MAPNNPTAKWLDYAPRGRLLDLEVFTFSSLLKRESLAELTATHRFNFYTLICVTEGKATQLVDFEPIDTSYGSVLVVRPGQVHNFGEVEWDGWMVIFRPEFLPSGYETVSELIPALGLDRLPNHMAIAPSDFGAIADSISRMQQDVNAIEQVQQLHGLLRYQLCSLLLRLAILHDRAGAGLVGRSRGIQRFARFRQLVEQKYARWHHVAQYADALACTDKSLTRATLGVLGLTPKDVIVQRVVLEGKCLLAHTVRPVFLISEALGFDEATNFAKFFKRETGLTPRQFRLMHRG